MKTHNYKLQTTNSKLFFIILFALSLAACKKDMQIEPQTPEVTENKMEVAASTAHFEWTVEYPGSVRSMVKLSQKEDMSDATSYGNDSISDKKAFSATATGLATATKYYYCYETWNPYATYTSKVKSFTTNAVSKPTVTTSSVTNITSFSATCGGEVVDGGGVDVTERGVCWSTSQNPTTSDSLAKSGSGTGVFTVDMTGLKAGTKYYVRAYAVNSEGTGYGEEKSFTTTIAKPTVTTLPVTNITLTSATCGGEVTDGGGAEVTERGICWNTSPNPTVSDNHTNNGTGEGSYTVNLTGLTEGTTYYVRAYAVNSEGTGYGEEKSFTAQAINKPTVTTSSITNITFTSATGNAEVTDDGGEEVTERGICWSISHNPTVSDSHANSGAGVGSYTVNMTGLTDGTTYYVRAYAVNSKGTGYGEEKSFTTKAITKPSVTTSSITNITFTSATANGEVTDDCGAEVTERGICWSISHNPTVSDSHTNSGTGMGSFSVDMTELTDGTTYYVRAYAVNSKGTSYGEEKSFTTKTINKPTVNTLPITNITASSGTGRGEVTDDGGSEVTDRGICWSTSQNPTLNGSHASSGTGTGSYSVDMSRLADGTTYYVRAYAVNIKGTSYGEEKSFTTKTIVKPTVTTSPITNITTSSATGGGNVTNDGNDTVTRGICWSINPNPTVNDNHASGGTGTGSFTVDMTGLIVNTTYYVRAYATNSAGTSYGSEVSFFTQGAFFSVSSSKTVVFSRSNLQYKASTNTWRFAEQPYDCIGDNNGSISSSYTGWIDLFGWGTSGWNSGANCYQPWSTSTSYVDYYPGGAYDNNLTGSYANADWGVYNAIINGDNQAGAWRTLTKDEWEYVLNARSVISGKRYAKACVNSVNGVILLPDNWNNNNYSINNANNSTASFGSNTISASDWTMLEQQYGVVFLPAAGYRNGTVVYNVGSFGCYWSTSSASFDGAYRMRFYSSNLEAQNYSDRCSGFSVRLVRDILQ